MKKIISMLALVLILLSTLPVSALAAEPDAPEYAWFPAQTMQLTQLAYESYSHGEQNAIDFVTNGDVVAPFTGKVTYVDSNWGYVVFQSEDKVLYADGSLDYMTVTFMHDENISDLASACSNGTIFAQGEPIYQQGGMGYGNPNAFGDHVHMAVYRGHTNVTSGYGSGDVYAYDALFINPELTTQFAGRGKGYVYPGNQVYNGAPSDYSELWKDLSYLSKCRFYSCMATTVQITDHTTFKTYPCSKKTCADSLDIRNGVIGEIVNVIGLFENSAGNYWYCVIVNGQVGYLFAGDAQRTNQVYNDEFYDSPDGYSLCQGIRPVR